MKKLYHYLSLSLLACSTFLELSCVKDELKELDHVAPKVYLSLVSEGRIQITPANVIIDKERKEIRVPIGVARSGNQKREAFTAELTAVNTNLPAGTMPIPVEMLSTTQVEVPAGKAAGTFYLTFPKALLDANPGKKFGMKIQIANTSRYELNTALAAAEIILDVADFADQAVDVTALYMKNAGNPFKRTDSGTRFGLLADWTVTASVKNMENGTKGGFDSHNNGAFMSLERWGSPAIPNGKIYQAVEMPAGKYQLEIAAFDGSPGYTVKDQAFLAVAAGETLPDITDMATAIGSAPFSAPKVGFTLADKQTVSFGIVANFIQDSQYFRIKQLKLVKFVNIFD
jgi:hypothetical protein